MPTITMIGARRPRVEPTPVVIPTGSVVGIRADVVRRRERKAPRVSVIIPLLDHPRALGPMLLELALLDLHEVLLVSGGGTDETVESARRLLPEVRVVHQVRVGKGNAVAAGLAAATGDILITVDADGSCDPAEIPRSVETLIDGADMVTAHRFVRGVAVAQDRVGWGLSRLLGWFAKVVLGTARTDVGYGYRALWADIVPVLGLPDHRVMTPEAGQMLPGDGFEFEALIAGRLAAAGAQVVELRSAHRTARRHTESVQLLGDGMRFLRALSTERRSERPTISIGRGRR